MRAMVAISPAYAPAAELDEGRWVVGERPAADYGESIESRIPEALLQRLWRERASRRLAFKTSEGKNIRVLYPGRPGSEAGPDFRDAIIHQEGLGIVRGDVELHLKQAGWKQHGHHNDYRYNSVALHAVLESPATDIRLPNGAAVPTVGLRPLLDVPEGDEVEPNRAALLWSLLEDVGYHRPQTVERARELLAQAGERRFLRKSQAAALVLDDLPPEEALYQSIMECLGYSENRAPFLELAGRVPYASLAGSGAGGWPTANEIATRLLDVSGLELADNGKAFASGDNMSRSQWRLFRIRPSNHPKRRIAGAAAILASSEGQLLEQALHWVDELSFADLVRRLTPTETGGGSSPIGRQRAIDIVINAILPMVRAISLQWGDHRRAERAGQLFLAAPKAQTNRIIREMEEQLFPATFRPVAKTLPQQQGLLALHRALRGEA